MLRDSPKIFLNLYLADVFVTSDMLPLQKQLKDLGCCEVHLLHSGHAIAVNCTNQPIDQSAEPQGVKTQNSVQERVSTFLKPLFVPPRRSFTSFSPMPFDTMALSVPDPKFEIHAAIPKGEVDRSYFPMSSFFMKDWKPMEMRICFAAKSRTLNHEATFAQIRKWHDEATSAGFGGEKLEVGELTIGVHFTGKNGLVVFPITMPYPKPVTYPWLELWVRLRTGLPKSQRCKGIQFDNP